MSYVAEHGESAGCMNEWHAMRVERCSEMQQIAVGEWPKVDVS